MPAYEFRDVELSTDGVCVYVDGMTLANILTAALPNNEKRKYPGSFELVGRFDVIIRPKPASS